MLRRRFLATSLGGSLAVASRMPAAAMDASFTVDAFVALNAYRAVVEDHLAGILTSLNITARTQEARSGVWERTKPLLGVLSQGIDTAAAIWLAQPDGSYDTVESGRSEQNLKDRDYFPDLMAGKEVLGSLVISKSTGHRSVIVATPVRDGINTVAAVGVSVRARLLSAMMTTHAAMPDDLIFYAIDSTGKTALHRDPDKMFQFPSDMGDPSLAKAVQDILASDGGSVTYSYQGRSRTAVFVRSQLTGWKFVLARMN